MLNMRDWGLSSRLIRVVKKDTIIGVKGKEIVRSQEIIIASEAWKVTKRICIEIEKTKIIAIKVSKIIIFEEMWYYLCKDIQIELIFSQSICLADCFR